MFLSPDDAARRIGVSADTIRRWEVGNSGPTLAQLRKAASVYKHSLETFLLDSPPSEPEAVVAFRTLPATDAASPSPAFAAGLRRATQQQAIARHLSELGDSVADPIALKLDPSMDPERCAASIRRWLGLSLDQQLAWRSVEEALRAWTRSIENKDILVIQIARVDLAEMRAFTEPSRPFPVIGINGKDAAAGKVFSLLHELVHVLLAPEHGPSIHIFRSTSQIVAPRQSIESFCNQVAAAALMPVLDLLAQPGLSAQVELDNWSDEQISQLSARYKVSRESLLLRLVTLGKFDQLVYRRKKRQYDAEYQERRQAQDQATGGGDYYRLKVRDLGMRFIADVLTAYDNEEISSRDVTKFLDVQLSQLPRLGDLVQRRG